MPVSNRTRNLSLSADRNKRSRDKKRQAGLCIRCGKESIKIRCDDCRKAVNEETNRRRAKLTQDGRCPGCGELNSTDKYKCSECNARQKEVYKRRYAKKVAAGTCSTCTEPAKGGMRFCDTCLGKMKEQRDTWDVEGRCRMCRKNAELSTVSLRRGEERGGYCKTCWLRLAAQRHLGSIKRWKELVDKLDMCGWRCPYTGEQLIVGVNLSFDHMDPVSRFPEKKHDINNIEPVTWQVNMMKSDLTKMEFLDMVDKIRTHTMIEEIRR
mgnify:CR=1 FL=1